MTQVKFNRAPVSRYDNFFNEFFNLPALWPAPAHFSGNGNPAANIHETPTAYLLELNAPGRNKEDFKVNVDNDLLTISYEKKEEKTQEDAHSIRREFRFNSFKRSFTLDEKVDTANIQASYENGILKIELPKKENAKAEVRQIEIS